MIEVIFVMRDHSYHLSSHYPPTSLQCGHDGLGGGGAGSHPVEGVDQDLVLGVGGQRGDEGLVRGGRLPAALTVQTQAAAESRTIYLIVSFERVSVPSLPYLM